MYVTNPSQDPLPLPPPTSQEQGLRPAVIKKKTKQARCSPPFKQVVPATARATHPVIKSPLISHPKHTQEQGLMFFFSKKPASNKTEQAH